MNDLYIQGFKIDWNEISRESYLRNISAIKEIEDFEFRKPVTFFTGENGSGKSTLLEAIAVSYGFNAEGGTKNYNFSTYDSHAELHEAMRLIKGYRRANGGFFLRAESFYNVATKEKEYETDRMYHEKSHGESFLALAQNQFHGNGVYILDEPEAALSPQRQLTLMLEINRCMEEGAQFLIATHSPVLMAFPNAEILTFDHGSIRTCEYEDTDAYKITKMFMIDRDRIMSKLFAK